MRILFTLIIALSATTRLLAEDRIDFTRQIRPLLAKKCMACHGPDEEHREADLRLDQLATTIESRVIVPGNADESELIRRIESEDEYEQMPPPDSHQILSAEEKRLIRRWVEEGAHYEQHWAFIPPVKPEPPTVQQTDWPRNPIDNFVLKRLEQEGLTPSPAADRYTLIRRVSLDLIGLPPTPAEADAFVNDEDPQAYERLVDRLLQSEHYGERWARQWLDLARYADTNGYEKDRERSIWPFRDWVIRALNDDMSYDQFSIEQLAGDMLPEATQQQLVATGFHRNTMLNEEGGIDPLEYRYYAMVDRVATTGTVWLGLTTGCAQCHTHKYDPITHTDYFGLFGLLNNTDEPDIRVSTPELVRQRDHIENRIKQLEQELPQHFPPDEGAGTEAERRARNFKTHFEAWLDEQTTQAHDWRKLVPTKATTNLPKLDILDDGSLFSRGDITKRDLFTLTFTPTDDQLPITALRLEALPDERLPANGPGRAFYEGRKGDFFLSEVTAKSGDEKLEFSNASHSYGKISVGSGNANAENVIDGEGSTGWATAGREGEPHQLVLNLKKPISTPTQFTLELLFERHFAASLGRFRISATSAEGTVNASQLPVALERLLASARETWTSQAWDQLRDYYCGTAPQLAEARKPIDALRKQVPNPPVTMVMRERQPDNIRPTYRHHRGEYLSPREAVTPQLPEFLLNNGAESPRNRLEFARWLVSDDNPLAARVAVNRAWQAFFGIGLVRTSEDFGTQGEAPSHPELLDWLACEFQQNNWSMKELHRTIVLSATYRQSSRVSDELLARDPENRLLARGPRLRVNGEIVRDIMLKASGLLSPKMYGPSVFPPQPQNVTALAYGNTKWRYSTGEDRYRRSLYTFSKRTAPFAAYTVFDAPTGENCIARRDRSNTPLQALTLLNDEMYLEMARALAKLATSEAATPEETAHLIFRRLLTRPPSQDELAQIVAFYDRQLTRLNEERLDSATISKTETKANEQAAWTMVARALMNLDEAITKP